MTAIAETAAALREKAADLVTEAEQLELGQMTPGRAAYERHYRNCFPWPRMEEAEREHWECVAVVAVVEAMRAVQPPSSLGPDQVAVDRQALAVVLDLVRVHPGQTGVIAACNTVAAALNTPTPSTEGDPS